MQDLVIIGAGTAGLSAAIYAQRAGINALVLESMMVGGQIVNTPHISNYPGIANTSGYEFAVGLQEQAAALGATISYEAARSISPREGVFTLETTSGTPLTCRSVIVATGAKNRALGLDGEEALIGRGISYCATCDGAFFRDKDVAVVGGGNTAVEDALFLSNYCKRVTLIHRRTEFRAAAESLAALRGRSNIVLRLDSVVTGLTAEDKLSGISLRNITTGGEDFVPAEGLFIAVGQQPQNDPFSPPLELDEYGYIRAGEDCKTNVPGIFAAGDCRTKSVRQLVTAAADGAVAALAAAAYIG